MDRRLKADYGLLNLNAMRCNEYAPVLLDQTFLKAINLNESFVDWDSMYRCTSLPDSGPSEHSPPSSLNHEGDLHEDSDFSDLVLKYINQMLMEEDIEEKSCMLQESAALQAAEKSFHDALMVKEPPFDSSHPMVPCNSTKSKDGAAESIICFDGSSSMGGTDLRCNVSDSPPLTSALINFDSQSRFYPSYSSLSSTTSVMDGFVDSPVSILSFPDMLCDSQSDVQCKNGLEEASMFLPYGKGILDCMGAGVFLGKDQKDDCDAVVVKVEKKHEIDSIPDGSRGKKNPHTKDLVQDGSSSKQSAVYTEATVRSKMFDEVLLCGGGKTHPSQCDIFGNGASNVQKGQSKASNGVKGRGKKQGSKKNVVDLRTLLSLCAQWVAANDQRRTTDLLKQIREHASPTGDGMQRLAHYFSAGLEARMAGSGTRIYKALLDKPTSAVDALKAYHLFLGFFPFTKLSNFVSDKTIMHAAQNKKRLHIIISEFFMVSNGLASCNVSQLGQVVHPNFESRGLTSPVLVSDHPRGLRRQGVG